MRWAGTTAASLSITLAEVDLFGRRAEAVEGRLVDLVIDGPQGPLVVGSVALEGSSEALNLELGLGAGEAARTLVALVAELGLGQPRVGLEPPDRVVLEVADRRLVAQIAVVDGAVVVEGEGLAQLVVLTAGSVRGFEPRSVAVGPDGGVVVEGRLDPQSLGLAG